MFNLKYILNSLSQSTAYFKSEKEIQVALYHQIEREGYQCTRNGLIHGEKVDLLVEDEKNGQLHAIQLRNKTAKLSYSQNDMTCELKQHGAQDQGRYDFLRDLQAVEKLAKGNETIKGYAVLMTNDHLYWQLPVKEVSVDEDFHLYQGRKVTGKLEWSIDASIGTKKNRDEAIELIGEYYCNWGNYSQLSSEKNGQFRYLYLTI